MSKMNIGNKIIGKIIRVITTTLFNHTANVTCISFVKVLNKYKFFVMLMISTHSVAVSYLICNLHQEI